METVDLLKQLEVNYKLISNDLEFASHQLDSRMAAAARSDSSMPDLHSLQSRIRALQTSAPILARDAADVMRTRQETEPDLNAALLENYNVMLGLYARLGVAPDPDWVAVANSVQGLVPVQSCKRGNGASRVEEKKLKTAPTVIFEEDFLGVSATTRGRARLQDVRKMYDTIRADYEAKIARGRPGCKIEPITKRELDAAGLKVFGLTGDSILNTLRTMGLVKTSEAPRRPSVGAAGFPGAPVTVTRRWAGLVACAFLI
eukprot:jgi/Undpi1/1313/HiC_scaffold_11.g04705.m1